MQNNLLNITLCSVVYIFVLSNLYPIIVKTLEINGGGVIDEIFCSKMRFYSLKVGLIFENVLSPFTEGILLEFNTPKRRLIVLKNVYRN